MQYSEQNLQFHIRKYKKKIEINYLSCHLKKLYKEENIKYKVSRRKGITKKRRNQRNIKQMNNKEIRRVQCDYFENSNKINRLIDS